MAHTSWTAKGTPDRPIVIRLPGDGEVVFDGNGCHNLFNVMAATITSLKVLTIRQHGCGFSRRFEGRSGIERAHHSQTAASKTWVSPRLHSNAGSKDFYIG